MTLKNDIARCQGVSDEAGNWWHSECETCLRRTDRPKKNIFWMQPPELVNKCEFKIVIGYITNPLSKGLGELLPCPMCGSSTGYRLQEGDTYRWWNVVCADCGRTIDDCHSDRRAGRGERLPDRWPNADVVWNEAGEYAEQMRLEIKRLKQLLSPNAKLTGPPVCAAERKGNDK